jgi:Cu2+-containing amine oxidase
MPSDPIGVDFKPKGFFKRSPVLDLIIVELAKQE